MIYIYINIIEMIFSYNIILCRIFISFRCNFRYNRLPVPLKISVPWKKLKITRICYIGNGISVRWCE